MTFSRQRLRMPSGSGRSEGAGNESSIAGYGDPVTSPPNACRGSGTAQPLAVFRAAPANAFRIRAGMSTERSFSNSAAPGAASRVATVSAGVSFCLSRLAALHPEGGLSSSRPRRRRPRNDARQCVRLTLDPGDGAPPRPRPSAPDSRGRSQVPCARTRAGGPPARHRAGGVSGFTSRVASHVSAARAISLRSQR